MSSPRSRSRWPSCASASAGTPPRTGWKSSMPCPGIPSSGTIPPAPEAHARPPGPADALDSYSSLARELADQRELIERSARPRTIRKSSPKPKPRSRALRDQAAQKEIEALLDGEADGNDTFIEINAGAGGTEAATGRRCSPACMSRWAEATATRSSSSPKARARRPASARSPTRSGVRTPMAGSRPNRRPPPSAHLALRQRRAPPYLVLRRSGSIRWSTKYRDRDRAERHSHRHLPLVGRRPAARQHHRFAVRITHSPTNIVVSELRRSPSTEPRNAMAALKSRLYQRSGCASATRRSPPSTRPRGCGLGQPDPFLRPAALPDGQGPAYQCRDLRQPGRARRQARPVRPAAALACGSRAESRAEAQADE